MASRTRACGRILWTGLALGFLIAGPVGPALARTGPDTEAGSLEQEISQVEALLDAQQARIESLQSQVEAVEGLAVDGVRAAEVRRVVRELLADTAFRETLYPDVQQAGYRKGFYLKSADEAYSLKINGFMRIRWTGQNRQTDNPRQQGRQKQDDLNGFEIEDLRLIFGGHLHDPRLTYKLVITADTDQGHDWRTQIAWIDYKVAEELQFIAGLLRPPFGRQQLVSRPFLQMIDRSMANELFTQNRTIQAGVHGTIAKRLSYAATVGNGVSNPHDSPSQEELDTNFSYYSRLVAHIFGEPIRTEGDLVYSKDPQLEVGLSFCYNDDNGDAGRTMAYSIPDRIRRGRGIGGNAMSDLTGSDYLQFGADAALRYRGFSATVEYWCQSIGSDDEFSAWELRTGRGDSRHQQGGYVQAGYFVIPKRLELAARVGGVWDNDGDDAWELGVGVNYFPWGTYNVMLQTDFTRMAEAPSTSPHANWSQNDEISMVRVQMQIKF